MEGRWFEEELVGCRFGDGRLDRRLRQLVEQMESGFGESIPLACQNRAKTKAAYRFFSDDRVSEEDILRGHFKATQRLLAASDGRILNLHDTTEFSWQRRRHEAVGFRTKWARTLAPVSLISRNLGAASVLGPGLMTCGSMTVGIHVHPTLIRS